jgi:hypothetical protein
MVKRGKGPLRKGAEAVAIQALSFIAADAERLGKFLAVSGIGPERIRAAAREPDFLAGVLDHVAGEEALLRAFAEEAGLAPQEVMRARAALAGRTWERDIP